MIIRQPPDLRRWHLFHLKKDKLLLEFTPAKILFSFAPDIRRPGLSEPEPAAAEKQQTTSFKSCYRRPLVSIGARALRWEPWSRQVLMIPGQTPHRHYHNKPVPLQPLRHFNQTMAGSNGSHQGSTEDPQDKPNTTLTLNKLRSGLA